MAKKENFTVFNSWSTKHFDKQFAINIIFCANKTKKNYSDLKDFLIEATKSKFCIL